MVTGGGSLSLARLAVPHVALATAVYGLSGAGSRLAFDAVTVMERPEWGALSGTVTAAADGLPVTDPSDLRNFLPVFTVNSGPCTLAEGGRCVGRWPGGYLPNEECQILVGGAGGALGACSVFDIHSADPLTLPDGSTPSGADCPVGTVLTGGQTLTWHSDDGVQGANVQGILHGLPHNDRSGAGGGWQICF